MNILSWDFAGYWEAVWMTSRNWQRDGMRVQLIWRKRMPLWRKTITAQAQPAISQAAATGNLIHSRHLLGWYLK
jgi:hypothetical protein